MQVAQLHPRSQPTWWWNSPLKADQQVTPYIYSEGEKNPRLEPLLWVILLDKCAKYFIYMSAIQLH